MSTQWRCVSCGKSGAVRHAKDASVYDVLHLLGNAHHRKDAECSALRGLRYVRVTLGESRAASLTEQE